MVLVGGRPRLICSSRSDAFSFNDSGENSSCAAGDSGEQGTAPTAGLKWCCF